MQPAHIITVDLGFGDSGKGTITDSLVSTLENPVVVRYNGGHQAAHNVHVGDRHHTFSQFGSGTFAGAPTVIGPEVKFNPISLFREAKALSAIGVPEPYANLMVDDNVRVTTPYHRAHNRIMEILRGRRAHGSCGVGIGATMQFDNDKATIRGRHLSRRVSIGERLVEQRQIIHEDLLYQIAHAPTLDVLVRDEIKKELEAFDPVHIKAVVEALHEKASLVKFTSTDRILQMLASRNVVYEAAQGVLLDEKFGFNPHTTWSNTTADHALELVRQMPVMMSVVGIMRTYMTRHGAGPMPTEDVEVDEFVREAHNRTERFQGRFRNGWLDLNLIRYALAVADDAGFRELGSLALTHVDYLKRRDTWKIAIGYKGSRNQDLWDYMGTADGNEQIITDLLYETEPYYVEVDAADVPSFISEQLGMNILVESRGPDRADKVYTGPDGVPTLRLAPSMAEEETE